MGAQLKGFRHCSRCGGYEISIWAVAHVPLGFLAEHLYHARAARAATLALAFFPTAFFLNAVYTEALFLALAAGSVWAARVRRDLLLAGVLGALAAATRNPGIFLLAPLFYEWLRASREFGWRGLAALGLVQAGLVAYASFLWIRFEDPLLFARQQQKWGRELANPVSTLEYALGGAVKGAKRVLDPAALFVGDTVGPSFQFSLAVGLAVLVVCLFLLGAGFAGLPPGLSVYAFVVVLPPVLVPSYYLPLMSLPRLVLGAFPVFLVLGFLLSRSKTQPPAVPRGLRLHRNGPHRVVRDLALGRLRPWMRPRGARRRRTTITARENARPGCRGERRAF